MKSTNIIETLKKLYPLPPSGVDVQGAVQWLYFSTFFLDAHPELAHDIDVAWAEYAKQGYPTG